MNPSQRRPQVVYVPRGPVTERVVFTPELRQQWIECMIDTSCRRDGGRPLDLNVLFTALALVDTVPWGHEMTRKEATDTPASMYRMAGRFHHRDECLRWSDVMGEFTPDRGRVDGRVLTKLLRGRIPHLGPYGTLRITAESAERSDGTDGVDEWWKDESPLGNVERHFWWKQAVLILLLGLWSSREVALHDPQALAEMILHLAKGTPRSQARDRRDHSIAWSLYHACMLGPVPDVVSFAYKKDLSTLSTRRDDFMQTVVQWAGMSW